MAMLVELADYAETEKESVVKRKCIVVFIGTLAFAMAYMIGYIVLPGLPEDSLFRNDGIWLGISGIGLVALWGMAIHGNRKNAMQEK